ncbi:MAG: hypothetical protein ABIT76_08605 [Chthoniobacterales bacterium]
MPDEEIKIVVREVSEGNALSEAQRKKDDLQKAENRPAPRIIDGTLPPPRHDPNTPANNPIGGTVQIPRAANKRTFDTVEAAAASIPKEAAAMEKEAAAAALASAAAQKAAQLEINAAKARATAETKAQELAERAITKQKAEQAALQGRLSRGALTVGQGIVQGGGIQGAVGNAAGTGGALGLAAIATYLAGELAGKIINAGEQDQSLKNRLGASRASDARGLQISSTYRASSGDLVSAAHSTEDEIFAREQNRKELERKATNPFTRIINKTFGTSFGSIDGVRAMKENEEEIQRLGKLKAEQEALGQEKFNREEGGLKLEIARARGKRTIAGNQERLAAEAKLENMEVWKRTRAEGGSPEQADEASNLATQETLRQRGLAAASGIVDARSGAADSARAAQIASSSLPGTDALMKSIDSMHETLRTGQDGILEARTRSRP